MFLVELCINLYCHWFRKFWTVWNAFDLLVVVVGMLSVARVDLPGPLSLLRMVRAFRVFRLFKRIESLNKIMVSLVHAIPGIINSALIMVLVMCIYAILGVQVRKALRILAASEPENKLEVGRAASGSLPQNPDPPSQCAHSFCPQHPPPPPPGAPPFPPPPPPPLAQFFGKFGLSGTYTNADNVTISSISSRELKYGDEYFGTFSASLLTTFQVLTGESWSEVIARPILVGSIAEKVRHTRCLWKAPVPRGAGRRCRPTCLVHAVLLPYTPSSSLLGRWVGRYTLFPLSSSMP